MLGTITLSAPPFTAPFNHNQKAAEAVGPCGWQVLWRLFAMCGLWWIGELLQTAGDGLQKRKMSKNRRLQAGHVNIIKPQISSINSTFFSCLTCGHKWFNSQLLCGYNSSNHSRDFDTWTCFCRLGGTTRMSVAPGQMLGHYELKFGEESETDNNS